MILLLGCSGLHPWNLAPVILDVRKDFGDAPDPGLAMVMPDVVIEPYEEAIYCFFGTYEGETMGVDYLMPFDTDEYVHHNQLKTPLGDTLEDGEVLDCTYTSEMTDFAPLIESVGVTAEEVPEKGWLDMPEGMAMRFEQGTKWVLETHYINATDKRILANSAIHLGFVDPDEVDTWVSPWEFDSGTLDLPPDGEVSVSFDCEWPEATNLLSVLGHMHELGTSFQVEWIRDGESTMLYEVEEWKVEYKDEPVVQNHEPGEIQIEPGDIFRTTCTWQNDGPDNVNFPEEMCTAVGSIYPREEPIRCINGEF